MEGGAWRAAVNGVTEGQTQLSDFTFTLHFHALEKEMATYSSVLAWRIPGMGEPGWLPSMGSHRVGHDWSNLAVVALITVFLVLAIVSSFFQNKHLQAHSTLLWQHNKNTLCGVLWWIENRETHSLIHRNIKLNLYKFLFPPTGILILHYAPLFLKFSHSTEALR